MNVPFISLRTQHHAIQKELDQAIQRVMQRTDFALGADVAQFEEEFAIFCRTRHAVGVDSGLSALKLILRALEIGSGDEVIVPAHTFIATAAAATFVGARPVFVDINPNTYNIDVTQIEAKITPRTKAVVPVHLYGLVAEMDTILNLSDKHGFLVIEDACQAHGAYYKSKRAGSLGHAAAFSFYPSKNLGACGDAGMIVTNDAQVAKRVRAMRNCGQIEKYLHELPPYNHRLDTLQAAILRVKLKRLDAWNAARRQHARLYNEHLADSEVVIPKEPDEAESVWHLYVIRVANRDALRAYLADHGIATGIHYPIPIHLQPTYHDLGYQRGDFPIAERYAEQILSLPMYPELTPVSIEYVSKAIRNFVSNSEVESLIC